MNAFITELLKIINNTDVQDNNYTIAYFILVNYFDIPNMSLQSMAEKCFVSVPTLKGFFSRYNFSNFTVFKEMLAIHGKHRFEQLDRRLQIRKESQVESTFENLLDKKDYDYFFKTKKWLVEACEAILKAKRIVMVGSIEIMQGLTRFQGDLTLMGKPVVQNTVFTNNMLPFEEGDLILFFSLSGRIAQGNHQLMDKLVELKESLITISYKTYIEGNSLSLNIPNYLDECLENMLIYYCFQSIDYHYYRNYYDIK